MVLSDTAGLRGNTSDLIEKEGILRAHQTVSVADLMLLVIDATHYQTWTRANSTAQTFGDFLQEYIKELGLEEPVSQCGNIKRILGAPGEETDLGNVCLVIFNKLDLIEDRTFINNVCEQYLDCVTAVSCKQSEHLEPLLERLKFCLEILCGNPTRENASLSQARHRYHLTASVAALSRYLEMSRNEREIDLAVYQLKQALNALGHITGHVSTEQILDVIFRDFCIGK
ncbi:tRNA modification GTPase gtpbp3, mitochondrial [Homalodisca vitripennis]|nr:tRNA modification GTPase gtpbp3, mitochondrial [Homalodisca vitripennis]